MLLPCWIFPPTPFRLHSSIECTSCAQGILYTWVSAERTAVPTPCWESYFLINSNRLKKPYHLFG